MKQALKSLIRAALIVALTLALYACGETEPPSETQTPDGSDCQHTELRGAIEREIPATCTEGGEYDDVRYCEACNKEISRERKTGPPLGHDEIPHTGKAPGCEEAGYDDYVSCSRCSYTTYEAIPATNHQIVYHGAKDFTCTEVGWYAYEECAVCDYSTYQELPARQHEIHSVPGTAPSCENDGYEDYEYCVWCEYSTYEKIPALGHIEVPHAAQEPTCLEFGWEAYVTCSRGECDYSTELEHLISPTGHKKVYHDAKAETCTEDGWDAYETCENCEYSTLQDNIIGHRHLIETDWGKLPTCTEIGWNIHDYCTRCSYKSDNYEERKATGHTLAVEKGKEVTCTEWGYEAYNYCTNPNCNYDDRVVIDAYGHNMVSCAGKAPTCTESGWEAYVFCDRCRGESTYTELDPIGHAPIITKSLEATCTTDGYIEYKCNRCTDYYLYEERPAFGHDMASYPRVEPTCTSVGYEALSYCRRCEIIANGKYPEPILIKTLDHSFVSGECTVCHNRVGSEGLEFEIGGDGRCYEVVGLGTCTDKVIVIPASHNGLPVTGTKGATFKDSDIVSIYIPNTFKQANGIAIDSGVFLNCYQLVEIINNSDIDFEYFGFLIREQNLAVHNGNSKISRVGDYYFFCDGESNILVSYAGTEKDIVLPESFNGESYKIHMNAFRESGIESIVIPTAVSEIGDWALYTKNNAKCVTVNFLGTKDEWGAIKLSADAKQWINTIVYHYGSAHTITTYAAKEATCTEAGYSAYEECSVCDYKSERVEYEPTGHFYEYTVCRFCGEEIVYSVGLDFELSADGNYYIVTGIGTCTDDYIIVPAYIDSKPVQEIGEDAFANKEILGVHLPVTVTHIGGSAFSGCYMLKYVSLGYEVETIDYYAFAWCNSLVAIKIGSSYLKTINSSAFMDCNALTDVYYAADAEKWNEIEINPNDNDCLTNADIHYNWVAK